jgi:hypothetical protein
MMVVGSMAMAFFAMGCEGLGGGLVSVIAEAIEVAGALDQLFNII